MGQCLCCCLPERDPVDGEAELEDNEAIVARDIMSDAYNGSLLKEKLLSLGLPIWDCQLWFNSKQEYIELNKELGRLSHRKLLVKHGRPVPGIVKPRHGNPTTILHDAQKKKPPLIRVIEWAVTFPNIDVDMDDDVTITALFWACRYGRTDACRALLAAKADVNKETGSKATAKGQTPLWTACRNGHTECCRMLLEHNPEFEKDAHTQPNPQTPLWSAACDGHLNCVKLLLDANACPATRGKGASSGLWSTPAEIAQGQGHPETAEFIENFIQEEENDRLRRIRQAATSTTTIPTPTAWHHGETAGETEYKQSEP